MKNYGGYCVPRGRPHYRLCERLRRDRGNRRERANIEMPYGRFPMEYLV